MKKKVFKIAFSWNELPVYGARLLKAGIEGINFPVEIIATSPTIPIKGMEDILGKKVFWVHNSKINSWKDLGLKIPNIFFQAGTYYVPSFKKLGDEVRNSGGKIVLLSDNSLKMNLRQMVGSLVFRTLFKNKFNAVWVPGKSGEKLMKFYGFDKNNIYKGLYGSDPNCFQPGISLEKRSKNFIFIGQLIKRKGIETLLSSFKLFHKKFPDWSLNIYGDGPYKKLLENNPGIAVKPFKQPEEIAKMLLKSRFLILPSLEDHWPLVVSEAALVGCGLILSSNVGNAYEFLSEKNGFSFNFGSIKGLENSLIKAASMSDRNLNLAYKESLRLGLSFTPKQWSIQLNKILNDLTIT